MADSPRKASNVNVVLSGTAEGQQSIRNAFAGGSINGNKAQVIVYLARKYVKTYPGMPQNILVSADPEVIAPAIDIWLESHGFPKASAMQLGSYVTSTWTEQMRGATVTPVDVSSVRFIQEDQKTFGDMSMGEIEKALKEAQDAAVAPRREEAEKRRYVDDFVVCMYNLDYRHESGLSLWLRARYEGYPDDVFVDIHMSALKQEDISDADAEQIRKAAQAGPAGRLYPSRMNQKTTPRLFAAKKTAEDIMGQYNLDFVIGQGFPIVFMILCLGMRVDGAATARARRIGGRPAAFRRQFAEVNAEGKPSSGPAEPVTEIDPITKEFMDDNGLTNDTELYRWNPNEHNGADGTVAGNPDSIALCADPYAPPETNAFGYPQAPSVPATKLGPGLNMTIKPAPTYGGAGSTHISVKLGDVLKAGGRIYPDRGAIAQGLRPVYVTFSGRIPFTVVGGI